jgi:UTP:GlnB (protein PII) uridylyltransferase
MVRVSAPDTPGALSAITAVFRDLGLNVVKAEAATLDGALDNHFHVIGPAGGKVTDTRALDALESSLFTVLQSKSGARARAVFDTVDYTPNVRASAIMGAPRSH